MMTPVILYDLIIGLSLALQVFTPAYILTGGGERAAGPDNSLLTFVYLIYRQAFQFGQMGYAAAVSVVLFVTSILLAVAVFRWATRLGLLRGAMTGVDATADRAEPLPHEGAGPRRFLSRSVVPRIVALLVRGHLSSRLLLDGRQRPEDPQEGTRVPPTLIPETWVWQNFSDAVNFIPFFLFAVNSLIITLGITIGSVLSNTLSPTASHGSTGLGANALFYLCLATIFLPYPVILVALFDIFGRLPAFGIQGSDRGSTRSCR